LWKFGSERVTESGTRILFPGEAFSQGRIRRKVSSTVSALRIGQQLSRRNFSECTTFVGLTRIAYTSKFGFTIATKKISSQNH